MAPRTRKASPEPCSTAESTNASLGRAAKSRKPYPQSWSRFCLPRSSALAARGRPSQGRSSSAIRSLDAPHHLQASASTRSNRRLRPERCREIPALLHLRTTSTRFIALSTRPTRWPMPRSQRHARPAATTPAPSPGCSTAFAGFATTQTAATSSSQAARPSERRSWLLEAGPYLSLASLHSPNATPTTLSRPNPQPQPQHEQFMLPHLCLTHHTGSDQSPGPPLLPPPRPRPSPRRPVPSQPLNRPGTQPQ